MKSPSWLSSSSPIGVSRRHRLLADLEDLADAVRGHLHLLADLLRSGLAPELLEQLALHADELVDRLDHVHGDADRAGLVGDRAGDRLADPPRRVRRELEALGVVELLDGADQAEVALLDQVEEEHAAADVALGDRDDESQVGLDELLLGVEADLLDALQAALLGAVERWLPASTRRRGAWRPQARPRSSWRGRPPGRR